jgi:hypothetical protein
LQHGETSAQPPCWMTAREPMAAYAPASQGIRDFCEELVSQHQRQRNRPDSASG